jgi:hypothetical protein
MEVDGIILNYLKDVLKVIMDNCGDVDFNVNYDEIHEIGDMIDDTSLYMIYQLENIIKKLGYDRHVVQQTKVSLMYLLEQFTRFKPNVEDYYESNVPQFNIFLKLGAAYREKYETKRFYKTKSARNT